MMFLGDRGVVQAWGTSLLSVTEIDVTDYSATQAIDERLLHVLIVVRNVQADHALFRDLLAELLLESMKVTLFHHEDDVGPPEVPGRDTNSSAFFGTGRANLMTADAIEHLLSG
jgi:hypothetical protein